MVDEPNDKHLGDKPKRTTGDYARRLFHNPYNYSLLGGVAVASVATGQWWLGIVGVGMEALYMLYAPDSKTVRNYVDKTFREDDERAKEQARAQLLNQLQGWDRDRCLALLDKQRQIRRLAGENPSFGTDLLQGELNKLDSLTNSFLDVVKTSKRYRDYLNEEDIDDIEKLKRAYERDAEKGDALAKKNLAVVTRRLERLREIREFLQRAAGQLELIENSFALLADQIVSMRTPGELSSQLNDLLDGVDAVRETARDTEKLMQTIEA